MSHLPARMSDLKNLRSLSLRSNQLVYLPREVTYLYLVSLDISNNRIASLPVELRTMTSLVNLELDNNPLTSPPASVSSFATMCVGSCVMGKSRCRFACAVWCTSSNIWTRRPPKRIASKVEVSLMDMALCAAAAPINRLQMQPTQISIILLEVLVGQTIQGTSRFRTRPMWMISLRNDRLRRQSSHGLPRTIPIATHLWWWILVCRRKRPGINTKPVSTVTVWIVPLIWSWSRRRPSIVCQIGLFFVSFMY